MPWNIILIIFNFFGFMPWDIILIIFNFLGLGIETLFYFILFLFFGFRHVVDIGDHILLVV
jgi:hypothetical protein